MSKTTNTKLKGVFAKGYGTVPKSLMIDPTLSLESKAIYAYFCALAGNGNVTFPYRSTILKHLCIAKNTFYNHYNPLIEHGFLKVTPNIRTRANLYTLNSNTRTGYGFIPREVMQDNRLSIKAKGLYAYMCALCGNNNSAFPKKQQILKHLNISEPTYYTCLKQLKSCEYIISKQRKIAGLFSVCDYYLSDFEVKKPTKNCDTSNTKICDTSSIKNCDNKNKDTYLTTIKSNNNVSNNNQSIEQKELRNFIVDQINRISPDKNREILIHNFLPNFCKYIQGKSIRNLSAYIAMSIHSYLAEMPAKKEITKYMNSSYDLDEIERLVNIGIF